MSLPVTDADRRVWFVTGSSTGLGRAVAEAAVARGDQVAATARDTSTLGDLVSAAPERVRAFPLDVTDSAAVTRAVTDAIAEFGRIDVLVNNAGHGLAGTLEELSDEQIRAVLDTNVLGVFSVTKAALPHMRARGRGHVVQMSSVGGMVANPGHCAYATSKFALEGMSESLAAEVAPFGIRVTIVEPGPFRTDFAGRSMRYAEQIAAYRDTPADVIRQRFTSQHGNQPNDPAKAAAAIVAAVDDENAPLRLPLGPEAVTRIGAKLRDQLDDLTRWEQVCLDTRYG